MRKLLVHMNQKLKEHALYEKMEPNDFFPLLFQYRCSPIRMGAIREKILLCSFLYKYADLTGCYGAGTRITR